MATGTARWNPLGGIERLWPPWSRDVLGGDILARLRPRGDAVVDWNPRCDVWEKDDAVLVQAELPGVDAKDMEVSIRDSQLVIRGEKRGEIKGSEKEHTFGERFFGSFERRFGIPEGVSPADIEARARNGVLEVRIPRPAGVAPESRKIKITVE